MKPDTFSEGVEPGGLRDPNDIRLLLCYLLRQVDMPLSPDTILSVIQSSGMANYFEAADALDSLQKNGSLILLEDGATQLYTLSEQGHMVAESLSRNLPASVRQKSVQSALQLLTRMKRESENKVTFHPLKVGYLVKCRIPDGDTDMMSVELRVPDITQAEKVRRRFMSDPAAFYVAISGLLTGDPVLLESLRDEIAKLARKESE